MFHASSRTWWAVLIVVCLVLEGVALYYQYVLEYLPCVLCIHVRMLLALLLLVSIIAWLGAAIRRLAIGCLVVAVGIWLWMVERSYQLLASERGWSLGECGMDSGLPGWLSLPEWFPWLFRIHEPCGYTPVLLKVTMAEGLLVLSSVFLVFSVFALISSRQVQR